MVPVQLPASKTLGDRTAYEALLKRLLERSSAAVAIATQGFLSISLKLPKV
jgi:hypothetical protein